MTLRIRIVLAATLVALSVLAWWPKTVVDPRTPTERCLDAVPMAERRLGKLACDSTSSPSEWDSPAWSRLEWNPVLFIVGGAGTALVLLMREPRARYYT